MGASKLSAEDGFFFCNGGGGGGISIFLFSARNRRKNRVKFENKYLPRARLVRELFIVFALYRHDRREYRRMFPAGWGWGGEDSCVNRFHRFVDIFGPRPHNNIVSPIIYRHRRCGRAKCLYRLPLPPSVHTCRASGT